jgi:hypothetical protein
MKLNTPLFILIIALFLSFTSVTAQKKSAYVCPDDTSKIVTNQIHKIIFQLTTSDTIVHKSLMKQLANIKSVTPDTKIEVVCHGPGLDMLIINKSIVLEKIKAAKEMGVEFIACEFSIKERKVDKANIVLEAGFVPAGIIEIVIKQELGWSYIKS